MILLSPLLISQFSPNLILPLDIINYDLSKDSSDNATLKKILRKKEFWEPRVSKSGKFLNSDMYNEEIQKYRNSKESNLQANQEWKALGPYGAGRLNCIRFHNSNSNQIWVGSATSGMWVSNNKGAYWEQVNLGNYPVLGISDIAFPVSNHNYIYVATGDTDGEGGFGSFSLGIMLSKDNGNTWEFLYKTTRNENKLLISRLIVNPENENELFAATNKGLMYFNNGNMKLLDSNVYFRDLEMKPGDFSVLYANRITQDNSFISKSINKGLTWINIDTLGGYTRAQIATTFANPNKVYAFISDSIQRKAVGVLISNDEGISWDLPVLLKPTTLTSQGQCFYNMALAVSPYFEDNILLGCVNSYKFKKDTSLFVFSEGGHVDFHDITFSPHSNEVFFANDGGIYKSIIGSDSSINISNNLNITQFYGMKAPKDNADIIYAGSQDNGGMKLNYNKWKGIDGGDVLDYQIDNINSSVYYTFKIDHSVNSSFNNYQNIYLKKFSQGQRVIFPNLMVNDTVLYFGLNRIIKTLDKGQTLINVTDSIETIVSFDIDKHDINNIIIACKTSLNGTKIYQSNDHGKTLNVIYENSNHIPNAIKYLDSKLNKFVVIFGYSDSSAKVLEFNQNKINNVTFNLPNVSINCIELDTNGKTIFIGSDIGVFSANYDQSNSYNWQLVNGNMPNLIVKKLELHKGSGKLRVATYGMGVWETSLYNCNVEKPILNFKDSVSFCDNDSIEIFVTNYSDKNYYKWNFGVFGKSFKVDYNFYKYYSINYPIYVTAFSKESNCIATSDLVNIKNYGISAIGIMGHIPNVICENEIKKVQINTASNLKYNCLWSTGSTENFIEINKAGKYNVIITTLPDNCTKKIEFEMFDNLLLDNPIIIFEDYFLKIINGFTSPLWYYNGKPISKSYPDSASTQDYYLKFLGNGSYYCLSYDKNGCKKKSNIIEVNINDIIIKPNEVDNILKVQKFFDEKTDFSVSVIDILGKEVNYGDFTSEGLFGTELDVSNLSHGKYTVIIKNNSILFQKSFIKK